MFRQLLLNVAAQPRVRDFAAQHPAARAFALRFVAGETLDDGVRAVRDLNRRGFSASLDHLGEYTTTSAAATTAADAYLTLFDRIAAEGLDTNVSLKLTQLGLDVDEALCEANLHKIVERAQGLGSFVRIDMEDSAHTQRTLDLFRRVYARFPPTSAR
ncbi:MAG: proline dehydrogenase family protein [Chloroflexota bacterium]